MNNFSNERDIIPVWHSLQTAEASKLLKVNPQLGLATAETKERLSLYGENKLAEKPKRPRIFLFLDQFKSLLILVLISAAVLAGIVGDLKDTVVILVVVLFNALLGFWQEYRAEQTLAALKKMLAPLARVRRNGRTEEVSVKQLVPGDIVLLEAGDRVPADGRLIVAYNLEIDESALTGESHPVTKKAEETLPETCPLAERTNMAYLNSVVTRGRGEMLVTATGLSTEMGRIAGLLAEADNEATPLQLQLDKLGRRLALIAVLVIGFIFSLGLLRYQPFMQILINSIALAVAAIPEGLPAVVTVTLAIGMHQMAKKRAIVKRLAAVETLGCTTVICTDKTGTLTLNQMTARAIVYRGRHFTVFGEGYGNSGEIKAEDGAALPDLDQLLLPAVLANESLIHNGQLIGDPTEGALLALAAKAKLNAEELKARYPRLAEIPFDSAHKFHATFHKEANATIRLYVKGAPDVLLARSAKHLLDTGETVLDEEAVAYWMNENKRLGAGAMRVLALANRIIPANSFNQTDDLMTYVQELTFVGLVGIIDPPRPEVKDAIALCKKAGIDVKMITGDHKVTAKAIAQELGLTGEVMEGSDLSSLSEEELKEKIKQVTVFARVVPEHKLLIVRALKAEGHVVAMTGDGVNDAPALKNADIGVAMGITGTEVAKEAATMVLTDDNFATIVQAVKEGRAIYDNIVKFVRFQLSTNIGAILTVLGASLLDLVSPFTAIQILWINIILDGPPAMSLGLERPRPGIMDDPPRKAGAIILTGKRLIRMFCCGVIMAVGTLGNFICAEPQGLDYALTMSFTTFVFFQFFNLFNARHEYGSAFNRQFFSNPWLWLSLVFMVALQVLVVHWPPAQMIFQTKDLMLFDWLQSFLVGASILIFEELRKLIFNIIKRLMRPAR